MTNTSNLKRKALRGGAALQALALLGAGLSTAAVLATPAMAQDYNQVTATGRVQGTNGEPVSGATVEIRSDGQGFSRTATTDGSGSFRIPALPQGPYSFTITASGFDTYTEAGIGLTQAGAANQFTLSAAGSAASGDIVVTAGRVTVADFDRNSTGAVINLGELATRVPVARDITSVALLSPGTTAGDSAFGSLPSINGASVSENVYYVNGLNITQFRNGLGAVTVPFDMYQTVDIKNGGIQAEFGRTTGGVINATTKSGSNEFHGGVTFNWEPDSLREDAPNTYATDNDSSFSSRREMIAQLSGPIIKDHLFFYGIYVNRDVQSGGGFTGTASNLDPRRSTANGLLLGTPVANGGAGGTAPSATTLANSCFINPTMCSAFDDLSASNLTTAGTQYIADRNRSPFYGGKIDAVIIDGQRLEATYFNTSGQTNRDTYGTSLFTLASGRRYNPNTNEIGGYASSTVFRSGGENYVFRYTGTFTNWLTLSAAYGVNKNKDTTESNLPDFPSITDERSGAAVGIGNTTPNANVASDKRTFYRADADLNFNLLGSHHVRFGYDREDLRLDNFITANGGFQYTLSVAAGAPTVIDPITNLPGGTQYVKARTFVSGGTFNTRNEAYYIQDSWQLFSNRLQLNLGVRNDRFVNRNGDNEPFYTSGNQWAPRLGFVGDVFGNGRTTVRGSFSRYFLPVAANTNLRLAGGELDVDQYFRLTGQNADSTPILGAPVTGGQGFEACPTGITAGNNCVVRNDGSIPGTASTVASNLKPQSTDEIILGVEHRMGRVKLGLFGTYTKLNESLEDAALDQAIVPFCVAQGKTLAACTAIFNGVHQYALINPGSDVSITLSDPLPGETNLRTATFSAASLGYPQAKRTYKAITATFDREWDGRWSLSGSYTWSKLRGNIEGGIRSDNGQTDSGLTTAFDLPALTNGAFGYLPNDRRHNFKLYGSYKLFDWLSLGANAQVSSPRRFGCLGLSPANADNNIAARFYGANSFYCNLDASGNVIRNPVTSAPGAYPVTSFPVTNPVPPATGASTLQLTPRGSQFKGDWLYLLNLDAQIKVPTDAFDGTFRISVFNVLNRQAELDFQEFGTIGSGAPSPLYGRTLSYQQPRFIRFQFNVGF